METQAVKLNPDGTAWLKTSPEVELMETILYARDVSSKRPSLKTSPEVELMETECTAPPLRLFLLKTSPEVELMETIVRRSQDLYHFYPPCALGPAPSAPSPSTTS